METIVKINGNANSNFKSGKNYYLLCFAACCYLGVAISTTTAHCAMI